MLTSEEKEILNAMREELDDEDKEVFDQMSEAEKKKAVNDVKKEMAKQMSGDGGEDEMYPATLRGQLRLIRDAPYHVLNEHYGEHIIQAFLLRLLLKIASTKVGCITLIVIAIVAIIVGSIM